MARTVNQKRPARAAKTGSRTAGTVKTAPTEGLRPVRYETLVDKVIESLIEGAARGNILPGDRIVESDIAQQLGISRVPIREAMRILENQGIVVSEPFKGIRLTPVTPQRINNLIEARIALETTAVTRAVANGRNGEEEVAQLQRVIDELELMTVRGDTYGLAMADTTFHRLLVQFSDNLVLAQLWEMLARQLTIIFGLSALAKSMSEIVAEHQRLVQAFRSGDTKRISAELDEHLSAQVRAVDLVGLVDQRTEERHVETAAIKAAAGRAPARKSARTPARTAG